MPETLARIRNRALDNPRRFAIGVAALFLIVGSAAALVWVLRASGPPRAEPLLRLRAPVALLNTVCYSHGCDFLAAGSATGDVVVWDPSRSQPKVLKKLSPEAITALAFSATGFLVAGTADRSVIGWQISDSHAADVTRSIPNFPYPISACAVNPQRFEVVVGLADGSLYIFGNDSQPKRINSRHAGSVKSICFDPDGDYFVTGGADGRLIWRDAGSFRIRNALHAHKAEVSGLAISPDGRWLASGDYDGVVIVRDADDRTHRFEFRQPEAVSDLALLDTLLVTGSWDGKLRAWSLQSGSAVLELQTGRVIQGLALDAQAGRVATVSGTNELYLWQIPQE